ncbi:MAG: methionine adenosyltransferase [Helicobacteraceae bacterium]|jgi:S-adenosylmethionine synthetase|nr:methionine adenosyltransferase [Helicobacteraceae bacterium]
MVIRASESVTEGQSDKIADLISDAVVDALIEQDQNASVSCETLISNGFCIVAGEISTEAYAPIVEIAKRTIREIGYTDGSYGFDYRSAGVITAVNDRVADVAIGARRNGRLGASDQAIAIGFACDETPQMLPFDLALAHKLTAKLAEARKSSLVPFLLPDGKAQVSVAFENGVPVKICALTIAAQHARAASVETVREAVMEEVVKEVVPRDLLEGAQVSINAAGAFVIGGPQCDTGLTGRKSVSDCYGASVAHGGGALSGKDPMRIDRAATYMARYVAKNIVASGIAKRAKVELVYGIGDVEPSSAHICLGHNACVDEERLARFVRERFDLSTEGIAKTLDLLKPRYRQNAAYGHFGREDLPWERCDRAAEIRLEFGV